VHAPFIKLISRIAVLGVPSSASRWISFKATISEVVRDRPCGLDSGQRAPYGAVHETDLVHGRVRSLAKLLQLNIVPV
jgi:hypothetical protein